MSIDRHAGGGRAQELLYDANVPTPSHAEQARTLASRVSTGTLCTLAVEPAGFPYGSFVTFGLDGGSPVLLISELAEHTRNLRADERASLLVVESGSGDPLARGRVTLIGRAHVLASEGPRERARQAYLSAHPNGAYYADFADFQFWQLSVESVRFIGGYGRMSWVAHDDWEKAEPDPLAPHAAGILAHMNQDHAQVMVEYCRALSKATDASAATMTGVDRYGFEMSAITAAGPRPIRLAFSHALTTPEEVRQEMVALARRARGT
jgi:heme oxygenase (biliverdin-IX-beta and delta-forming)